MKLKHWLSILPLALFLTVAANGQTWSGILHPSRAIDWSQAGVVGGIPARPSPASNCATLGTAGQSPSFAQSVTSSQINSAINSCPSGQVVYLNPGTYSVGGILMKSGVTLRGAGADQTILNFTGTYGSCTLSADICFQNGFVWDESAAANGGSNSATWSSGYAKGATQIVLTGIGSAGLSVGQYIYLDQMNDLTDTGNLYVCDDSCSAQGGSAGRKLGHRRSQVQAVKITACNPSCTSGATFTISPGLYASNWRSSQNPGASWSGTIQNAGIEDLTMNHTSGNSSGGAVVFAAAFNCWLKGVKSYANGSWRNHLWVFQSGFNTVQNSYFYGGGGASLSYGIEARVATSNLYINNIFQHVTAPFVLGTAQGDVVAYNFTINDFYSGSFMNPGIYTHDAGSLFNLMEGNITAGTRADIIHGGGGLNTAFRNRFIGWESGKTSQLEAVIIQSFNRYYNLVGNVLGRSGTHTTYQTTTAQQGSGNIYELTGDCCDGTSVGPDPLVASTLMRWGNWDAVSNAVRWQASEVPSALSLYANEVPSSQNLPASFFLSSRPSWWPTSKPWPAIGPDITGGNLANAGGFANSNPAADCYANVMGGPADGSGTVLSFNANNCYTNMVASRPQPPSGLTITSVQ